MIRFLLIIISIGILTYLIRMGVEDRTIVPNEQLEKEVATDEGGGIEEPEILDEMESQPSTEDYADAPSEPEEFTVSDVDDVSDFEVSETVVDATEDIIDTPAIEETSVTTAEDVLGPFDISSAGGMTVLTLPEAAQDVSAVSKVRVATFNTSLYRDAKGKLIKDLASGDDAQAKAVAAIIQRTQADIILLNEFDYDQEGKALQNFMANYLGVKQVVSDVEIKPIAYPYSVVVPSNTGIASGLDLDKSGRAVTKAGSRAFGNDAFGFGAFAGQYGFAILSRFPIDEAAIRSFQKFKWQDMPESLLPTDYYSQEARNVLRLSSKNHVDIPLSVSGQTLHVIAAHPTPPTFDGAEDRNGKRNHDEIRLLADYINAEKGSYLVDDNGTKGGLPTDSRFVVLGDLNADPRDGSGVVGAIQQLLNAPTVQGRLAPVSAGGLYASKSQLGVNRIHRLPATMDTADFSDSNRFAAGNLRLDYVLPSKFGLVYKKGGVFWPEPDDTAYALVGDGEKAISSDHRLVWLDLEITP